MRSKALLSKLGAALLFASPAIAADPAVIPAGGPGCAPQFVPPPCNTPWTPYPVPGTQAPGTQAPGTQIPGLQQPGAQQPAANQAPQTDAFAQAPPTGGEGASSALPNMIGDLATYGVAPRIVSQPLVPFTPVTVPFVPLTPAQIAAINASNSGISSSSNSSSASYLASRVPVTTFGGFKISDNGTVAPEDRVFLTYNYYNVDGFQGNSSSINREMFGFEKTFLDGQASFGMRVPFTQVGEGLGGSSDVDALSFIGKYTFYRNADNGNIISGGLVVTVPTGPDIVVAPGSTINPVLLQPYIGYAFNFGRFYVLGFTEVVVPTDSTLSTFFATDIGIGYRLESIPVIPTFEIHTNDAFNHQGAGGYPLGFDDSVSLTWGAHFLVGHADLTLGVNTPVAGPRLYGVEAIAQLNWGF
jgi:hypothetical protein